MKTRTLPRRWPQRLALHRPLALALLAALGTAQAETRDLLDATLSVGAGAISGDAAERAQLGQYTGMRHGDKAVGLLGLDFLRLESATGTRLEIKGSNLLGDTRELDLKWMRQGDWKLGASFSQGVRHDPYSARTALAGAGTSTPQVRLLGTAGEAGGDVGFKVKRTGLGLSLWTSLSTDLELQVDLKSEAREGSRLFGIGMSCPSNIAPGCRAATAVSAGSAVLLMPEPIDSRHSQVDARLSWVDGRLRLSAGYYGSFYQNAKGSFSAQLPQDIYNPLGAPVQLGGALQAYLSQPVALAPDNHAHHLDVTGLFIPVPSTQLNFKLGYSQARQTQDFAAAGLGGAPAGVSNLGGAIDTWLVLLGVHAQPLPRLSLNADFKHEDSNDSTPIAPYNLQGSVAYTNRALPLERTRGRAQAIYRFVGGVRGTLGLDYEFIDRGAFTPTSAVGGVSALRRETSETTLRAEVHGRLADGLSASVGLHSSRRWGSDWLRPNSGVGVTAVPDPSDPADGFSPAAVFSPTLANRERDKLRLRLDWQASEALLLQLSAQGGKDRFKVPSQYGVHDTGVGFASADAEYKVNDKWSLNGRMSFNTQTLQQSRQGGTLMAMRNRGTDIGVGFSGKPQDVFEFGGSLSWVRDRGEYAQTLDTLASNDSRLLLEATGGLPDTSYRQMVFKLFGAWQFDKQQTLRLELLHHATRISDWTWASNGVPFVYSDGSTLWQQPRQSVSAAFLSYSWRWR